MESTVRKDCLNCNNNGDAYECFGCSWFQNWVARPENVPADIREGYRVTTKDTQIGGSHYQAPIQPIDFIVKNDIKWREANVIKYVFRHAKKNGVEDLRKARHYLDMLIEEYEQRV